MDWSSSVPLSKDELRAGVDLTTVIYEELGVALGEDGQGLCPFHDDSRPSFAVFESDDGVDRVGCWACGWRGDVFDVIQAARDCSFSLAQQVAKEYIGQQPTVVRVKPTTVRDFTTEFTQGLEAFRINPTPVNHFVQAKGYPWSADWLHSEFYVGVAATAGYGSVMIPHFDMEGRCVGYKHRTAHTPPVSAGGSRFPLLYGSWRDNGQRPVVITEGESDTWAVAWYVPEVIPLGLPTGAATSLRSEWLTALSNRQVSVCFDGDQAGLDAADRWATALPVRTIRLPKGVDAVAMGRDLRSAILVE